MLCFRCEHRARFLQATLMKEEYVPRPRAECGDINSSNTSCYMFQPCKPVVTTLSNIDDNRPRFGGAIFSSRERAVRILEEAKLTIIYSNGDDVALGWNIPIKK